MTIDSYAASGVDTEREEPALERLKSWVGRTAAFRPDIIGAATSLSAFASVLNVDGVGLTLSTDGVGSKLLVAQLADRYDTIGIDCVAMNVNDIVVVGAEPLAMLDYLAIEAIDPDVFEAIGKGLHDGARDAGVAIVGGETSQMPDLIKGARPGRGFDLVGMCIGRVDPEQVIDGSRLEPGDLVIGLASSGVHSNGLSLARKTLLHGDERDHQTHPDFGKSPLEELLTPTRIYVQAALALVRDPAVDVRAMAHITGDGLLNLLRVNKAVGFEIDALPEPPAVFAAIAEAGDVSAAEMYTTFNMGVGYCVVVPEASKDRALQVLASYSEVAQVIGRVTDDPDKRVSLPALGLIGSGRHFRTA